MSEAAAPRAHHRLRAMAGRDMHESGRVASPLELLYDLVFVLAIAQAASQLAHLLAEGHTGPALAGFALAMFAILWAWVNFSWFSSAFDTDDWAYRLMTMVQMVGVTILGLGIPRMVHSLDSGHGLDTSLMVAGYVVMRVAMVGQWLRAARQSPTYRRICLNYAALTVLAQLGWMGFSALHLSFWPTLALTLLLIGVEFAGPYRAETRLGGTPWHAHHIAERYSLLAIIALGEGIVGTVASLSAVVGSQGWTLDAILVAVSGMGLTFGMWWCYFMVPAGELLHRHRERAFAWGYGSLPLLAAIAATGAGLDVAAMAIEGKAHIGPTATVLALAVPVGVYQLGLYLLYSSLSHDFHPSRALLMALTLVVLAAAPLLAAAGVSIALCLLVIMLAPAVSVIGFELSVHRQVSAALARPHTAA